MVQTSAHPKDFVVRSDTEPPSPFPGQIWQDTSGNNTETNQRASGSWELIWAIGPDNPDNPVEGSIWRNTDTDENLVWDGAAWQSLGVSDHGNLAGLVDNDHAQYARSLETPSIDLDSSKSGSTWYQNTTGSPVVVITRGSSSNGPTRVIGDVNTSASNNPVADNRNQDTTSQAGVTMLVPDQYYWRVRALESNDSIDNIAEIQLEAVN